MLTTEIHQCPRCGGAINVENHAEIHKEDYVETYTYCEFCRVVIERQVCEGKQVHFMDYRARTEPCCFNQALKRLEAARAA